MTEMTHFTAVNKSKNSSSQFRCKANIYSCFFLIVRSQFERAITACGLEFRSDRLWDSYIKWENDAKRLQKVTAIYDRLLTTPTQCYTTHFDNFQEHVAAHAPNKLLDVDEFMALRKEVDFRF